MTAGGSFMQQWVRVVVASAQSAFGVSAQRSAHSVLMAKFATLPTAVLARIFAFADGEFVSALCPTFPQLPAELFATLLLADAASLRPVIEELQKDYHASVVSFEFDAQDIQRGVCVESRLVKTLEQAGDRVRCLAIGLEMLEYRRSFEVVKGRAYAETFDNVSIDWLRVFALCPRLQRLDLSGFPLRSVHLPALLHAAATHCRHVKALVLPDKEWYRGPVGMDAQPAMEALYRALQLWYRHNGGLQQLTVPHRTTHPDDTTTRRSLADEFLLAVASSCPQLEHFDGWKVTLRETEGMLRCDERIHCSLEVWQLFCRLCPKIQEIQWCVFPLVDAYFRAFAAEPHPQLKKLTLTTSSSGFPADADDDDVARSIQYEWSTGSVVQAIAACPALEQLSVVLQEDQRENIRQFIEHLVGDELVKTLATSCPRLQQLDILQADSVESNMFTRDHYADSITDAGFRRLASLPDLRVFRMNVGSQCGADGLLALVASSPRTGPAREIELLIGSYITQDSRGLAPWMPSTTLPRKNRIQFHAVLLEFLELLIVHKAALEGRRFSLTMHNGSSLYANNENDWQDQMEVTAAQLAIHCPSMQLRIIRQGGIVGATLVQSRHSSGSIMGVRSPHTTLMRAKDTKAQDWTKYAWYATMQALTLTALFTYRASTRLA